MLDARTTYNNALRLIKDGKAQPNLTLKKLVVTSRAEDNEKTREMKLTPANIRVQAVRDLIAAFKTAAAGYKARVQRQKTHKTRWLAEEEENGKVKGKTQVEEEKVRNSLQIKKADF
jgi:purine-nucleoside phosphorylase